MSLNNFDHNKLSSSSNITQDIRLVIPLFLLNKLKKHPLTQGTYPVSLGKITHQNNFQINHDNTEHHCLIYCQSGRGILEHRNKIRDVNRGDLVIYSPRQSFLFSTQPGHNNAFFWVNFSGKLADDFAERLLMKMDDGLANVGILSNIINDFDSLLALGSRGYTATNVIHAVHVLQQALSFLALQLRLTAFNNSSTFDIDDIETLMRNNLHQELSLDTLAHYSQLSKFHFAKKFKELTDTAPIQHFINMKMQQACLELDNSDKTIKTIAESLGYNDPYYFSRLFKKIVGMSPKQYRDSRHS
ncbi:helix-turn-helix transcriptional regulator [Thalassotalea profundi]|nr:AraC family transcriptional regulator [Thalassotalea profundi]